MFVFIDESGNSGQNMADKDSPFFYHLALLSKYNIDLDLNGRIKKLLKSHSLDELHEAEISNLLDELSPTILQELKDNNASFYYAEVEKSYLAYAKLYDTLFDNEENLGVRWSAYQLRPLRLMLLCNFIGIVDEKIAIDFYKNCLIASSQQQANDYLNRTCKLILSETYRLKDFRTKQIIEDALNGAKNFSSDITMFEKSKQDRWRHLPHIVSFLPMLNAISVYSRKHNSKVQRIIHDEQEQVQHVITEMHSIAAKAGARRVVWDLRENGSLDFKRIPEKSFEMKDSTKSYGIQITDVCLYILTHAKPDSFCEPHKYELYNYINEHLIERFIFSKRMLYFEASLWYNKIMNSNLSQDQIEFGKDFVKKMDDKFYERLLKSELIK